MSGETEKQDVVKTKKELFRLFNAVNKEVYGYGVTEFKITCVDNMVIFTTKDNRVHTLQVLEERHMALKRNVDQALFDEFKLRLYDKLTNEIQMQPTALFRDYDPESKLAVTIAIFNGDVTNIFL